MADKPLILDVSTDQAERWFARLLSRASDLSGLMADIGETLTESTQGRFDTGIGPDGVAWQELADGSGRTPLKETGRMRDGIHPASGPDWVEIRADAKQARWHQEGTGPYEIVAKPGKALFWPGMQTRTDKSGREGPAFVKRVHHPGLPARPFLGVSAEDDASITTLAIAWLELDAAPGNLDPPGNGA
ncbi:phage virion morphogenesis protein [Xanthomonas sp. CFBP 8445]|uniref:phage virion morphogenesis protein n=1 Tax=Xanthomonas sp. CFBP 8445 TaxID=2971236 RepID=UPI0002F3742F|nr:phage virion morphogenesis protein [Xanthomonas sp. CFBP 8445]UYC12280.1 phage virion morphogenesis protein [Xanthomonas sp. CFBP 8445]